MALDGLFLHKLTGELKTAEGMHIDKIYQPSNDELVLLLRRPGETKRLLISAAAANSRIHFTESRPENPATPPMFCMLMRKYLSSSKLISIEQKGLERVVVIKTSGVNEMGDIIYPELVVELMGAASNIILVLDNKIIDALHRSNIEKSERIIHPGAIYALPESNKINILESSAEEIFDIAVNSGVEKLEKALLLSSEGFSPLVCREIAGDLAVNEITGYHKNIIIQKLRSLKQTLISGGTPIILKDGENNAVDFSFMPINQYGKLYSSNEMHEYSALLEEFYTSRATKQRVTKQSQDILKLLTVLSARAAKRRQMRLIDLEKCADREQLRIFGELLKANLYAAKTGQTFVDVQNYYDENLSTVRIPLNPALTPSQNAAKYFKDYKKSYTAEQKLVKLIEQDKQEIEYFDAVLDALSRAETLTDISAIRDELAAEGYIKRAPSLKRTPQKISFGEAVSPSGYKVLYGKNNRMNEELTLKTANKNDMWFHIKDMAGSHVVVLCGGKELSEEDMDFAATLAAQNSKGAKLGTAPVDYTRIKNVRKIPGGKTGMVTYTDFKTYFVRNQE